MEYIEMLEKENEELRLKLSTTQAKIEKYEKALKRMKEEAVYYDSRGWALNPNKIEKIVDETIQ